jgi:glycosyltransferase involved in cell wall biosynthesis
MLVTAALIVKDEAADLDACLSSIDGLVDEVVVIDTGSDDESVAVATRHDAVVGHEPWRSDFSTPRNRSLDLASGEWILYIDADERARGGDHAAVRDHLAAAADHIAFRVRFVPRVGWTPYEEMRIWRNRPEIRFEGSIHETTVPAIEWMASRTGARIGVLETLTIEHLGYEGDQRAKHRRNEPMLRRAVETNPERLFLYDHLARIYEDLGDDERARATWRAGIDAARSRGMTDPDARLLWIDLIVHTVVREDPDGELIELLNAADSRFPGNPALEFARGSHELHAGEAAAAAARFERLTQLSLDELIATKTAYDGRIFGEWSWNSLGLCRFALGDYDLAAAAFRVAEAANPDNEAYRTRRRLAEARRGMAPLPDPARPTV